jgi:predicted metalloprotease with PDZ domain
MKEGNNFDLTHSLGMMLDKDGKITSVQWGGVAFNADIVADGKVLAVGGLAYSKDRLTDAIKTAKDGKTPISLLIQRGDRFRIVDLNYAGGLRYPHLEKMGTGVSGLDALLEARRK